jgi:hypothetical protein
MRAKARCDNKGSGGSHPTGAPAVSLASQWERGAIETTCLANVWQVDRFLA